MSKIAIKYFRQEGSMKSKTVFPVRFKSPKLSLSIINFFAAISIFIFITYKHLAVLVILIMSMHTNTMHIWFE